MSKKKKKNKKNTKNKKTIKNNINNINKINKEIDNKKIESENTKEIINKTKKIYNDKKLNILKQKFNINIVFIFYITLLFSEITFRALVTNKLFPITFIYVLIYLVPISILLSIITSLFNDKVNKIITKILLFIIWFIYALNVVFKSKFGVFFSIDTLGLSNQVTSFVSDAFKTIYDNIFKMILLLIPFILSFFIKNNISYINKNKKNIIKYIIILILSTIIFYGTLFIKNKKQYSIYNLYFNISNNSLLIEKTGISIATNLEFKNLIFKFKDKNINITVTSIKNDNKNDEKDNKEEIKYNVTNIDFDELSNKTNDNKLITMNNYFKNSEPTNQNKYTGKYKGKNLILFMAESFNSFAISKELTPTLYKLTNESFVFENYYSPVILSTIGGEFQELTGLYPHISLLSNVWRKGTNYYEYGLGSVFNNEGYLVNAYHNNQYNFQNRDKYLNALGFNNYVGCGNGLETKINCNIWPQSDTEMIEATIDDYKDSKIPFMTYYVTVSGHMSYDWNNAMSKKYKDKVQDLNYPENVKAYIATQIELDNALKTLIDKLEKEGILDDTVIALVGDHYPYDLSINDINKASSYTRDDTIEINHSSFILWNNKTKKTTIKKVGSQIDVLPTLLNLFGINYDSRLIIGKDILSDSEGLAIFNNNSWVSDKGKYFASTNTFIKNDENDTNDYTDYIKTINNEVNNRINMSKYILEKDYYKYLFENTKKE